MLVDTFANRLQKAINLNNIRPIDLANKTGIDKSQISNYLSGNYKASQNNISLIAKELNVSEPWLMGYDVPINEENKNTSFDELEVLFSAKGYMKTVCVKIYDYAIDYLELPTQNIARKLKIGSKPSSNKHVPFTEEEISILWGMQHNDLIKITLIWLYTGLRPNELFKTERDNIYLEDNYFITGSKTEAGINRIIPIHNKIKHLIKYFYLKEDLFNIYDKTDYNKIKREFNKLMTNLNMEHTPYDCRHTFITKMKKAKTDEFLLKRIVGHSIQDLTEKTYTHRDIEDLVKEVNKIN